MGLEPSNKRIIKIVALGVATGAVTWLPLAGLDLIPKQPLKRPIEQKSARNVPANPPIEARPAPSLTGSFVATDARTDQTSPALLPASADAFTSEQIGSTADRSGTSVVVRESLSPRIQPSRKSKPKARQGRIVQEIPATRGETNATSSALAQETPQESSTSRAESMLRQPERVAVASFEAPSNDNIDDETGTIRLMHELRNPDSVKAEEAVQGLKKRGFSEEHLEIARQLTSPDPGERAKLAGMLPSIPGIDARLWLTWLLRDDVTEVRAAAINVLVTTGDPTSLGRVLEIARQDRDPHIRQQVERIEKMQKASRGGR